jgi:hypothetical protein
MTLHTKLSYVKSAARLVGYIVLFFSLPTAAAILIFSELIGIAEEAWPGAYKGTDFDTQVKTQETRYNELYKKATIWHSNAKFIAQYYEEQINEIQEICLNAGIDPDEKPITLVDAVQQLADRGQEHD